MLVWGWVLGSGGVRAPAGIRKTRMGFIRRAGGCITAVQWTPSEPEIQPKRNLGTPADFRDFLDFRAGQNAPKLVFVDRARLAVYFAPKKSPNGLT